MATTACCVLAGCVSGRKRNRAAPASQDGLDLAAEFAEGAHLSTCQENKQMNITLIRLHSMHALALLLALVAIATAAEIKHVRAILQPATERRSAPEFTLKDSSGETAKLTDYRGKVVLVDFWATWCEGCKEEIPWFSEFQKTNGTTALAVIGVSMDDGGWPVVKPFLTQTHVPYRILLGDDATAQRYGIQNLPDTFLIDRQGRIAAVYRGGLVDKDDVDANIRALISEH
jgi:peroxiredoxin